MEFIKTLFLKRIGTERADYKIASIISFIFAVLILVFGVVIMGNMNISSIEQLFLSLSIILLLVFQIVLMGLIMEVLSKIQNLEDTTKG